MSEKTDLSIIIVNYNVKEFLQNSLNSIEKASSGLNIEVIVVDNASDDGSIELLREKYPQVTLIANKENLGFSKANNLGLKIAKGEYLLLLNPDTIVQEDTFSKMIDFFENNPEAGLAGCKVLNPDGTLQLACRRGFPGPWTSFTKVTGLSSLFPKSKLFARYNLTYLDEEATYEVDAISGAFMMMKREVYEKVGGLDERFFMYGEDLDWCYRVQLAGWKVYYVHETQIIHYKGESTKRSTINETKTFYSAMDLFVQKHFTSSFLITFLLRLAIIIRSLVAFVGKYKLVVSSLFFDIMLFNGSLYLSERIYMSLKDWNGFPEEAVMAVYTVPILLHIIVSIGFNVYQKENLPVLKSILAIFTSFFLLSATTFFFKEFAYSRGVVLLLYVFLIFVLTGWRIFIKIFFKIGLRNGHFPGTKTLIIGTDETAIKIAKKLQSKQSSYHSVSGLLAMVRKEIGQRIDGFEIIGSIETIQKVIKEYHITEIIFPSGTMSYHQMMGIVAACQNEQIDFKVAGSNLDFIVGKSSVSVLDDIPLIDVSYNISRPLHKISKRIFDFVLSTFVLIFIYPFIFLLNGIRKKAGGLSGLILRIPKVWIGRRSLVGPKQQSESDLYLGKSGLTGLWFTEGEEENTEKLDIYYARNQSIWLDVNILGKTINKLLTGN